ncbi:MAG: Sec-independent protein translocase subunit TatA [Gammaproteobacteria bacterium]
MGIGSFWHWMILLIVVLLIFGTRRLRTLGSDVGASIKGFKEAMKEGEKDDVSKRVEQPDVQNRVIDADVVKEKHEV